MLIDAPIAKVEAALLSIEPAHFRHVRLAMRDVVDSFLLYDADAGLRDHAVATMTGAEAARERAFGRARWLLDDIYLVALTLAEAGEIAVTDLNGNRHAAAHPPLYRWGAGGRPDARAELAHYTRLADDGDTLAALCAGQILARTSSGFEEDWPRVYALAQQAALDPVTAPRAMRLMARAAAYSGHADARAARVFWACSAHFTDPGSAGLLVPGTDIHRALAAMNADDVARLRALIDRKGPDLRVEPLFSVDDVLGLRVRKPGEPVPGTERLAGKMRVRPPTAHEAAPEKVQLLRDIHLNGRGAEGPVDPETAGPEFLATCLLTLTPPHMRHLCRHTDRADAAAMAVGRTDALADLARRAMTDAAWRRLHQDFRDSRASDAERAAALVRVYGTARWLSDLAEIRLVDLDGHSGGADRGLYDWPDGTEPDPAAELEHYLAWDKRGVAFATLAAAQILTEDEDGRADPGRARPLAERAAKASRTRDRAEALLARL